MWFKTSLAQCLTCKHLEQREGDYDFCHCWKNCAMRIKWGYSRGNYDCSKYSSLFDSPGLKDHTRENQDF